MDFSLSDEQLKICQAIEELCRTNLNDNVFKHDEQCMFPRSKWDKCAEIGIQGLPIPEEYGGCGQGMLTTALAIKSLALACKDEGLVFSIVAHMATCAVPLWLFGSEEQKNVYLPKIASGESIGGNGITEAGAGSDTTSMSTSVIADSEAYILNGTKIFVTNAPEADLLIIYAKHPGGLKMLDTSAFIILKDAGDIKIGQKFEKMGLRTSTISEVILDNCRVPRDRMLGRERFGMSIFNESMVWERILMSAYHLGAMEQQYKEVLQYANIRKQFGKKIAEFESVYGKLVEMRMRIESSRLMLYKTCWDFDNGKKSMAKASMLKLHSSEGKVKNSLDAVQILGAYGYMKESMAEKQLRDSIAAKIYSGTSEMQNRIIAQGLEELDD